MSYLGVFGWIQGYEWILLLVLGLLLFGRKLPSIARSLGQSVVEFKKGIKGIKDDVETSSSEPSKIQDQTASKSTDGVIDVEAKAKANSDA